MKKKIILMPRASQPASQLPSQPVGWMDGWIMRDASIQPTMIGILPTDILPIGILPKGTPPRGIVPTGILPIGILPKGTLPMEALCIV